MRIAVLWWAAACALFGSDYDIIIRKARVIDGTGNPWFRADIGIRGGHIAKVGPLGQATASREIDARERIVAPGFIDVHTHVEKTVEKLPRGDNFLLDGVTTIVTGNCGGSELMIGDWLARLDKAGLGLNVGTLIGHNSVRAEVMGTANRPAKADDIERMQALVERGMREGAFGFSTGLIYIPGAYSNTDEVVALARAAAKYHGTYASHMRDEGEHVLEAISEAVTVGKQTGMPVELSHFKIDNQRLWGSSDMSLALVEKFRREGVDVVVDQYPYDRSSTNLGITLPKWALADGTEKIRERLTDPQIRSKITQEMEANLRRLGHADYSYATVASFWGNHAYDGKTIAEIAAARGGPHTLQAEIDTIFEIMLQGNAAMVYHSMSNGDVERILRSPFTAVASDGGIIEFGEGVPHPRSYGNNARVLAEYVRNRKVLTLEDAIRRMTSLPARTFHLSDRGILREGAAADVVVFDPDRVQDKASFDKPHQYAAGFDFVLVNGHIAVEDGKLTSAPGGAALRHRQ